MSRVDATKPLRLGTGRSARWQNGGKLKEFLEYIEMWQEAGGILDAENPLSEEESTLPHFYQESDGIRLITVHAAKGL